MFDNLRSSAASSAFQHRHMIHAIRESGYAEQKPSRHLLGIPAIPPTPEKTNLRCERKGKRTSPMIFAKVVGRSKKKKQKENEEEMDRSLRWLRSI